MKTIVFQLCLFFLFCPFSYAQNIKQIDSLTAKMCASLANLKAIKDDVQVTLLFQKHLPGFYDQLGIASQEKADSIKDLVYYRLQRNCNEFTSLLSKLDTNKSDWNTLTDKPKISIGAKQCKVMSKGGRFFYKEYNGNIVKVTIGNNFWEETFEDGTQSKLSFIPKNNCEFDLNFIESNNEMRKNFSVSGDVYNYGMFSYRDKIYELWVFSKGVYYTFRLYETE